MHACLGGRSASRSADVKCSGLDGVEGSPNRALHKTSLTWVQQPMVNLSSAERNVSGIHFNKGKEKKIALRPHSGIRFRAPDHAGKENPHPRPDPPIAQMPNIIISVVCHHSFYVLIPTIHLSFGTHLLLAGRCRANFPGQHESHHTPILYLGRTPQSPCYPL